MEQSRLAGGGKSNRGSKGSRGSKGLEEHQRKERIRRNRLKALRKAEKSRPPREETKTENEPQDALLKELFNQADTNQDGEIDSRELQAALSNGTWKPFNERTVHLMLGMYDTNESGTINFEEFKDLWKYMMDWQETFHRFDANKSGSVSKSELVKAITAFGYTLSKKCYDKLVERFDRSGKGELYFDDFVLCCISLQLLTGQFRSRDTDRKGILTLTFEDFISMVLDSRI